MTLLEAGLVLLAGLAAGTINTVVGSGTLVTFPTLLAFGVPPVTANVSNTVGLVPGSISGAIGYRRELSGQRSRVVRLAGGAFVGGLSGAVLLLLLPPGAFEKVVPVLIVLGCLLVIFQPRISAWVASRHEASGGLPANGAWWVWPLMALASVYGGYFGAAQGVLYMAIMGIGIDETLQRLNGVKNILAAIVNGVAGIVFAIVADVDWLVVLLIGIGSIIGGQIGASYGRRLPPTGLRAFIVVVGVAALVSFLR